MLTCPNCKATHIVKYGKIRSGTQNYKCRECGRRFVEHPTKKYISQETWVQIDKFRSYAVESVTSTMTTVEYGLRLFHPTFDKTF